MAGFIWTGLQCDLIYDKNGAKLRGNTLILLVDIVYLGKLFKLFKGVSLNDPEDVDIYLVLTNGRE